MSQDKQIRTYWIFLLILSLSGTQEREAEKSNAEKTVEEQDVQAHGMFRE